MDLRQWRFRPQNSINSIRIDEVGQEIRSYADSLLSHVAGKEPTYRILK